MGDYRWQLRRGDEAFGTLTLDSTDMFWTDCHFEPGPAWSIVQHMFEEAQAAWEQDDVDAALKIDEELEDLGPELVPEGGAPSITMFLLRINGDAARFRY